MAAIRIYATTVLVSDQDRALDFYVNRLGWEKRDDSPYGDGGRWLVVAPPGAESGFALLRPADVERPGATVGGFSGVNMVTPDIQALYTELSGRGVTFDGTPQQMPWGDWATSYSDPDGNSFFVIQMGSTTTA